MDHAFCVFQETGDSLCQRMVAVDSAPSTALLEANRRLHALQERTRRARRASDTQACAAPIRPQAPQADTLAQPAADCRSRLATLPEHLGWESATVSATLRRSQPDGRAESPTEEATSGPGPALAPISTPAPTALSQRAGSDDIKLYPDLALGMLQHKAAAAGRIWLLLRHIDATGRGWLDLALVRENLAAKDSALRVCSWRQLRHLLQQGRGIYWERDRERIWLRSAAKVAAALGVTRLTGQPVVLPVAVLLGGMGEVRAHFYASFHSGRQSDSPISRAKLKALTRVPERTQRLYEDTAGVARRRNIAIGQRYSAAVIQERSWQHGRAVFAFVDARGKQGPAGRHYVAWQLPNSYTGCHKPASKGRQKKINRQIDLVTSGAQGNDLARSSNSHRADRLFHPGGLAAGKTYNRNGRTDVYWPASWPGMVRKSVRMWHVVTRSIATRSRQAG